MKPVALLAASGKLLLSVLAVWALSACSPWKAYNGADLPDTEVAIIERIHSHGWMLGMFGVLPIPVKFRHWTRVISIDGSGGSGFDIHVRPDHHYAIVDYHIEHPVDWCSSFGCLNTETATLTIDFTAEAGQRYRILAERREARDWIWVENVATGKMTAGEQPPD